MSPRLTERARAFLRGPELASDRVPTHGRVRLGRRTKDLVPALKPGEVAVIDHADLDRMAAEDLVRARVAAVVNVADSSTGRYPNSGPLVLARAGVKLVDAAGSDLFELLSDGEPVSLDDGVVRRDGEVLCEGVEWTNEALEARLERQRAEAGQALRAFAENTIEHVREEAALLLGELGLPATRTDFRDRHVMIVVRGPEFRRDLAALRPYFEDVKPVLVAVDGGADALIEEGLEPDVVLGDMDSASDAALTSGAELVVHAYAHGEAPGRERLERLGLEHVVVPLAGTSQDLAMLLAHERGAKLIVTVGAHFNALEFLDKDRAGMSSTFLTRLRIGESLVDARGVSRLYEPGASGRQLAVFVVAALVLATIVVLSSPALRELVDLVWLRLRVGLGI